MTVRIGRYEVLGELATGGMAEILLARLVGPSGFERPVVLKRIRDLRKAEVDLVSMFLEEARLAARIRHGNVVHVEDLGLEIGVPYLVMEYLEGENVSGVARRLLIRGERLSMAVAAFIVSEACSGLHAAHELVDDDGKALNVAHRDVSPQNVFATYDGDVKILDFGIAKVDGHGPASRDEHVMGKFAYMAPEQFARERLDRRADVFALGILLYELVTGHHLFKRFTPAATIRAATKDPIVPPSRVSPDVPPSLERICLRALSRHRDDRYSTAAEMRRELIAAIRGIQGEDDPAVELGALMRRCFPDRIEDKRRLFRSIANGSTVEHVPKGDVDATVEIPCIDDATITLHMGSLHMGSLEASVASTSLALEAQGSDDSSARLAEVTTPSSLRSSRAEALEPAPPTRNMRAPAVAGLALLSVFGATMALAAMRRPHEAGGVPRPLVGVGAASPETVTTFAPMVHSSEIDDLPRSSAASPSSVARPAGSPEHVAPKSILRGPKAPRAEIPARLTKLGKPVPEAASVASAGPTPEPSTPPAASTSARGFRRFQ